jgi:hypothetical protein
MKNRKKEYVIGETKKYNFKGEVETGDCYYKIYRKKYFLGLIPWWEECQVNNSSLYNRFYSLKEAQTYLKDVLLKEIPNRNKTEFRVVDKITV